MCTEVSKVEMETETNRMDWVFNFPMQTVYLQ